MRLICAFALLLASVAAPAQEQDFDAVEITAEKITDSVYMLKGMGGNIGVCVGEDGTFIVDDQFAPLTEKIVAAIATFAEEPVDFVINTHWHYDHTDGNENLGRAGAVIVSHENSRRRMETEQLIALFETIQEPYSPEGLPKITFDESVRFHLNGETIDVMHTGPGHTDGDAVVYFRDSNVIHTGDVFVTYGLPFIDQPNGGSINGIISAVNIIDGLIDEDTVIIPGHGEQSDRNDLRAYREMLITIRDRVAGAMAEGRSRDEIIAGDVTAGFPANGIPADAFKGIVYDSLLSER